MVGQDDSGRVRSTEFETTGLRAADLDQRLDAVLAHSVAHRRQQLGLLDWLGQIVERPCVHGPNVGIPVAVGREQDGAFIDPAGLLEEINSVSS